MSDSLFTCEGFSVVLQEQIDRNAPENLIQVISKALISEIHTLRTPYKLPRLDGVVFSSSVGLCYAPKPIGVRFTVEAMDLGNLIWLLSQRRVGKEWEEYIVRISNPYLRPDSHGVIAKGLQLGWRV